ncbi:diguanylate cyclase domain-containing protein [Roseofilum sp. Guam]|uniref:GGDEF domain-containing response regulator n=1 Tax=Roseofilum sp. Guam TaxID=2821502 RepID=UPI001B0D5FEA|nr:diguanylate cyclase [Roseofilum sp. Guam]MBP0030186.1 diguanylate cyclase [Roseofilum sp. Guam]
MLFSIDSHHSSPIKFPVPGSPFELISGGRGNPYAANPPRVLAIAADPQLRSEIRTLMSNQGYAVTEVDGAIAGLRLAQKTEPDIILLDGSLSDGDSLTCCQQLQTLWYAKTTSETPGIFMLHSLDDPDWVTQALNLGIVDMIAKPIHGTLLVQRVKRWWEQTQKFQELTDANQELQRLAGIDRLTQLANRHYFDETLEREVRQMKRAQTPLSLILADVDYFKLYNDCYGHLQGDRCLQEIAQGIQRAVRRPQDLVARYGGEEFAVILPQTDAIGAIAVARNIRHEIRQLHIPHAQSEVSDYITLSLGIACAFPEDNCSAIQLIQAADRGLYRAKEQGRDRLEESDEPSEYSL